MTTLKTDASWPFKWSSPAIKHIRVQMDRWIDSTPGRNLSITLKRADYDLLLEKLPVEFLRIGKPMYEGRLIKRMGDK